MNNIKEVKEEEKFMTPKDYFDKVKAQRHELTDEKVNEIYENCLDMLNKSITTGQIDATNKLIFQLETIDRESEIVKLGITSFVYREDVEHFIDDVSDKAVKLIELEQYERAIPSEIVDIIDIVKGKFDKLYVVFTDYTDEMGKKVAKERRDKDPILFGAFENKVTGDIMERFYYIGDWEDEYCDLTLDKMVMVMKKETGINIKREINTPQDVRDLKAKLEKEVEALKKSNKPPIKKGIFSKVKTFLTGKK